MILSEFLKFGNQFIGGGAGEIYLELGNVDDVFRALKKMGVKEVEVNEEQMFMIVSFIFGNLPKYFLEQKEQIDALVLIKKGKIDSFFGIKLILK